MPNNKNLTTGNEPYIGSPDHPRTTAVVAYITFIVWLISYFALYPNKRTAFSAFHLRQALMIHLISLLLKIAYSFTIYGGMLSFYIISALSIGLFVLWVIGIVNALNGKEKPLPIIGSMAQNMFRNM